MHFLFKFPHSLQQERNKLAIKKNQLNRRTIRIYQTTLRYHKYKN